VAAYVYPGGTAYAEGMRAGAVLYRLDYQHFFSAEDVKRVVEGMRPGSEVIYEVMVPGAGGLRAETFEVLLSRYPTFLYPLSGTLWQASIWGFALAAFLHLLALAIVAPLAGRTQRTRQAAWLFAAAAVWVGGQLARLLAITAFGPPIDGPYAVAFSALTYVALSGWVLFPALLLYAVLGDVPTLRARGGWRAVVFVPAGVLGGAVFGLAGGLAMGPLTLDTLIAPVLFYVCCYVTTAAALTLAGGGLLRPRRDAEPDAGVPAPTAWSRAGSALALAAAAVGALSVVGVVPLLGTVSDATAGWLILALQLLTLAPVGLASLAALRHGRVDAVVT
jgi:two-component system, LytTR family, sensor kinase